MLRLAWQDLWRAGGQAGGVKQRSRCCLSPGAARQRTVHARALQAQAR